jgi:hypothetical protein
VKHPTAADYIEMTYDPDKQLIIGNEVLPRGLRLDKRVIRPKKYFQSTLRSQSSGMNTSPGQEGIANLRDRSVIPAKSVRVGKEYAPNRRTPKSPARRGEGTIRKVKKHSTI